MKENEAIKKDFPGFTSDNGPNGTDEKDLMINLHDINVATKVSSPKRKHLTSFAIERKRHQMKFNHNTGKLLKKSMTTNTLNWITNAPSIEKYPIDDDYFKQSGLPEWYSTKMSNSNATTNRIQFSKAEALHHRNHYHPLIRHVSNRHQNRFYINQNGNEDVKLYEGILNGNMTLAGLINDFNAHKLNVYKSQLEMKIHQSEENLTNDDNYETKSHSKMLNSVGVNASERKHELSSSNNKAVDSKTGELGTLFFFFDYMSYQFTFDKIFFYKSLNYVE